MSIDWRIELLFNSVINSSSTSNTLSVVLDIARVEADESSSIRVHTLELFVDGPFNASRSLKRRIIGRFEVLGPFALVETDFALLKERFVDWDQLGHVFSNHI